MNAVQSKAEGSSRLIQKMHHMVTADNDLARKSINNVTTF